MNIICGVPRSGTSALMGAIRAALGEDRIMGIGPLWARDKVAQPGAPEDDKSHRWDHIRAIFKGKAEEAQQQNNPKRQRRLERMEKMNPKGFWECRYTCRGIFYHPGIQHDPTKWCKIVSQGLANSDPKYIGKILYLIRDPREVAVSQKDLDRGLPDEFRSLGDVISPSFFIQSSMQAAHWIMENKPEVLVIHHRDLMTKPEETLAGVRDFIGEGDFTDHGIDPALYRNREGEFAELTGPHYDLAMEVYAKILESDWQGVVDLRPAARVLQHKERGNHPCFRLGRTVHYPECLNCKSNPDVAANFAITAGKRGIDWEHEPCAFEIGAGELDDLGLEKHLTPEESVANNHWKDAPIEKMERINREVREANKGKNGCGCKANEATKARMARFLGHAKTLVAEQDWGYKTKVDAMGALTECARIARRIDKDLAALMRHYVRLLQEDNRDEFDWDFVIEAVEKWEEAK